MSGARLLAGGLLCDHGMPLRKLAMDRAAPTVEKPSLDEALAQFKAERERREQPPSEIAALIPHYNRL